MKEFIIQENDSNQRLDKFLQKAVPLLPKSLMYKYLRLKRIKVNGKKADISYRLSFGDCLQLYIQDEFFANDEQLIFTTVPPEIEVIYEDDNILLCNKPVGLCVHEDNDNSHDTLINRCLHYLYKKGEYNPNQELSFIPALCNRIDRNTSGIVIIAKNAESLRLLNQIIKDRELKKYYLCVVSGIVSPAKATLKHFLIRQQDKSIVRVIERPASESKTIITHYTVKKTTTQNSLLEVELETGRTHQIRAHMAYIHHPIIGDGKYGIGSVNRKYGQASQLLCAYRLGFCIKDKSCLLAYLNDKEFRVPTVWFEKEFSERF